jgi:spore coat protein U-like protein
VFFARFAAHQALNGCTRAMQGVTQKRFCALQFQHDLYSVLRTSSSHHFLKDIDMKKIALIAAAVFAALGTSMNAHAVDVTGTFNVNITLTSNCSFSTAANDISFSYTSFQGSAITTGNTFAVRCTNNLPYTLALDRAVTDAGTGTTYAYTDTTTALNYSLVLSAAGGNGGGLTPANYSISATMPANQSGNCATAGGVCDNNTVPGNKQRTLTISY